MGTHHRLVGSGIKLFKDDDLTRFHLGKIEKAVVRIVRGNRRICVTRLLREVVLTNVVHRKRSRIQYR